MKLLIRMPVILLLTFICSVGTAQDKVQEFKLQISLSKDSYLEAEPIWLDATLTNIGKDTLRILGLGLPSGWGFKLEIKDEEGNILKYTGPEYDYAPGPGYILKPQESYYECFNLNKCFGGLRSLEDFFLPTLKVCNYTAKAEYWIERDLKISSNEIKFEVKSPTGDEQKAYELLRKNLYQITKEDNYKKSDLKQLVTLFPNSVYTERAYKELLSREEFIEKFPDSGFNQTALRVMTERMVAEKKEEEKQRLLKKIISDYPKTRSAKFAEKIQRGW
jgi:hypothetical protein